VDFNSLANVLCQRAEGSNPMVQLTCMAWLKELVALAKPALKAQYADILSAVLPTLSHSKLEIREVNFRFCLSPSVKNNRLVGSEIAVCPHLLCGPADSLP